MYYHPLASTGAADRDGTAPLEERSMRNEVQRPLAGAQTKRGTNMHRVLIPVDGSEGADRAVSHLIGAMYHRAPPEVHLLNVQPLIMTGDVGPNVSIEMVRRTRLTAGEEALRRAQALLDASGIPYTTTVLFGSPAEAIVRYIKDRGIDAIVMGTRGMSALKNFLLGSVAAKVVGLTEIPVTLVK